MVDESTGGQASGGNEGHGTQREVMTTPEGFKIHGRNETSVPLERRLSPKDFPTPRMAFRNNLTPEDVGWFATEQADAAKSAASRLNAARSPVARGICGSS